jgi:hypothetical protein
MQIVFIDVEQHVVFVFLSVEGESKDDFWSLIDRSVPLEEHDFVGWTRGDFTWFQYHGVATRQKRVFMGCHPRPTKQQWCVPAGGRLLWIHV